MALSSFSVVSLSPWRKADERIHEEVGLTDTESSVICYWISKPTQLRETFLLLISHPDSFCYSSPNRLKHTLSTGAENILLLLFLQQNKTHTMFHVGCDRPGSWWIGWPLPSVAPGCPAHGLRCCTLSPSGCESKVYSRESLPSPEQERQGGGHIPPLSTAQQHTEPPHRGGSCPQQLNSGVRVPHSMALGQHGAGFPSSFEGGLSYNIRYPGADKRNMVSPQVSPPWPPSLAAVTEKWSPGTRHHEVHLARPTLSAVWMAREANRMESGGKSGGSLGTASFLLQMWILKILS